MKNFCTIILAFTLQIGLTQELLLVIDEQYANKTFDSFDDLLYQQMPGDLHWGTYIGANPSMIVDLGDGNGIKSQTYYVNPDSIFTFTRIENRYTTSTGLVLETKAFPDVNDLSPAPNEEIGTAISLYYPWSFRRGYFEIKAKLPYGDGIQSAFHLFGELAMIPGFNCDDVPGDQDKNWQEIDIWETGGSGQNTLRNNIHWSAALVTPPPNENFHSCDLFCDHCQYAYSGVDCKTEYNFTTHFHTIGLYWDEQFVIFLINGDIYRYWIRLPDANTLDCNSQPDPIQTGDPRKILFTDAMSLNLGIGYGIADGYDSTANPGNLNGPNPELPLPESKLEVEYFRYWTFLPCEDQGPQTYAAVVGNNFQIDQYNNDKVIDGYHPALFGHYETGRFLSCGNTDIGPSYDGGVEAPYWYSDQLNLIASKQIKLENGFHAKAAGINYPINAQFHGKIQTCSTIPLDQPMPWVNNMSEIDGYTFLENFMANIGVMIFESYKISGNLRLAEETTLDEGEEDVYFDQLSLSDRDNVPYHIFPNPTNSKINFDFSENLKDLDLKIILTNMQGEIIVEKQAVDIDKCVDISDLSTGTYLLQIIGLNYSHTYKIIKT